MTPTSISTSTSTDVFFTEMPSPVGRLTLTWERDGLSGVLFDNQGDADAAGGARASWIRDDRRLAAARAQLEEYFAGARGAFDLPLLMRGTPFQERVWRALCRIPFGATATYGEIAAAVGRPGASRAVGGANHRNPIAIVVPCHRVIGADGSLTGYGGGESRKRRLLDLERRFRDAARAPLSRTAAG
jgi:methylated-DNA-[protein]-cysteine S-methyltransferase